MDMECTYILLIIDTCTSLAKVTIMFKFYNRITICRYFVCEFLIKLPKLYSYEPILGHTTLN